MANANNSTLTIDRYGVMGSPISHSRSPVIHKLFAAQTDQSMSYEPLKVEPDDLADEIQRFKRRGGRGLNITVPHKSEAVKLVDRMSDRASVAGAVNTLRFQGDEIYGDNTDGIGLVRDLLDNVKADLSGATILILGAGGATRGIIGPLLDEGPAGITVANRTVSRGRALSEHFSSMGPVTSCRFDDIADTGVYDIIINATSAGLKKEAPPYPPSAIQSSSLCYDLSYALSPTEFVRWAEEHGAQRAIMGWGMLIEQAAESFYVWRNVRPDTQPILDQLTLSAS